MDIARRRQAHAAAAGGQQRRHKPDYWLLILAAILLTIGLVVVYAISPALSVQQNISQNYYVNKQLIAVVLGVVAFLVAANVPLQLWRRLQVPLIVAAVLAAIAVRIFGDKVNGAYRWIQIGGVSFQAAELIKFALLIWLAGFLADRIRSSSLSDFSQTLKPLLIALVLIGVVVAGVQSDLGSTGVMVVMMAIMAFVAGLPLKRIVMIGAVVGAVLVLAVSAFPYRRARLLTYLHPTADCLTTGYQSCQALIAVGSGGMIGLGLGSGVQAYGYLPEAENDSIFAIYAEKFGFVGVVVLLGLFVAFFARLKNIIERAPDEYTRLLVTGILAWLSIQAFINIGAMIGLLPLKGITLPFISYGGTSLLFVMAAVGVVFQISRYTLYRVPVNDTLEGKRHDDSTERRRLGGAYHPPAGSRG